MRKQIFEELVNQLDKGRINVIQRAISCCRMLQTSERSTAFDDGLYSTKLEKRQ